MSVFMGFVWVRGCLKSLNRKTQDLLYLVEPVLGLLILRFEVREHDKQIPQSTGLFSALQT